MCSICKYSCIPLCHFWKAISIGILVFLMADSMAFGQGPEASPSPDETATAGINPKLKPPPKPLVEPSPAPDPGIWEREEMTGNWDGTRDRWKEKGVTLEFRLLGFVQGTADGGLRHDTEWNGKFIAEAKFDLGKLWGWKYWSAELKTETRFGGPVLGGTGALNPANTTMLAPKPSGTAFAITALNVTKLIPIDLKKGNLIAVSAGRYNLLDLIDEDFFAGSGETRFWNMAHIGPLTVVRQVPFITNGASFAYVRHGEPFFTFAVIDPNDHETTTGLSNLFGDGVTFYPGIHLPTKWFGKSGKHSFEGAVTTKSYTPFDAIRQIVIPGPPLNPLEPRRGSWSLAYVGRQYIVERGKRDGWGIFVQASIADEERSPVTRYFDIGLGGNGLFKSRPRDEFGIAWAYTGLSRVLKDNLNLISLGNLRPRSEFVFETFYNFHITPWLRFTGDLQVIRPTRQAVDMAIVPGARVEIIF